jgi:hypothetical protein
MIWPVGVSRVTVSGPSPITTKPAVVTASTGTVTLCIWPAVSVPVMEGVMDCASGESICTWRRQPDHYPTLSGIEQIDDVFINIIVTLQCSYGQLQKFYLTFGVFGKGILSARHGNVADSPSTSKRGCLQLYRHWPILPRFHWTNNPPKPVPRGPPYATLHDSALHN